MSAVVDTEISTNLYQVARKALDYALKALVAADPLVPFLVLERNGETTIERYMNGAYDDSIEMAMRAANRADESVSSYAVVWNGYIKDGGQKQVAVVLEVGDRRTPESVQLAQPYSVSKEGDVTEKGDMLALGSADNLLRSRLTNISLGNHLIKPAYATTESLAHDVISQPYAQMPVALICLAANLFPGEESEHVTQGIRCLQKLEAEASVTMNHRVFSALTVAIADGDLMHVLPTDDVGDLAQLVLDGAMQLKTSISKGLVWSKHAKSYFDANKELLATVLTDKDALPMPAGGDKLVGLLEKATAGVE